MTTHQITIILPVRHSTSQYLASLLLSRQFISPRIKPNPITSYVIKYTVIFVKFDTLYQRRGISIIVREDIALKESAKSRSDAFLFFGVVVLPYADLDIMINASSPVAVSPELDPKVFHNVPCIDQQFFQ